MKHISFVVFLSLFLVGCSSAPVENEERPDVSMEDLSGGVLQSTDFGKTYEPFVYTERGDIRKVQIYSLGFLTGSQSPLFAGSQKEGFFSDQGEGGVWKHLDFPPEKIYAFDGWQDESTDTVNLYVTGVYQGRGKIYKSNDGGTTWEEIYTEPADNTVILSLVMNPNNPNEVYAGTSEGVIIKTRDGGETWENLQDLDESVYALEIDAGDSNTLYILLFEKDIIVSRDGGRTIIEKEEELSYGEEEENGTIFSLSNEQTYSLAVDPRRSGTVYGGTKNGVFRSTDFGKTWERLRIIESVVDFPIRSIAVSPFSSEEIVFGAARVVYRSSNGGETWQTFQLDADATPAHIVFDPVRQGTLYVGLRDF